MAIKKRIKWFLILLATVIFVILINNIFFKKTEFFLLESESTSENGNIYQHIVIANPPKNIDSLASIIKKHSKANSNLCEVIKKENHLRIFYYKETWDTPRDFKSNDDDCNFGSEYIGCHTDDIICVLKTKRKQNNKWEFIVRKNRDSDWISYPFKTKCNN